MFECFIILIAKVNKPRFIRSKTMFIIVLSLTQGFSKGIDLAVFMYLKNDLLMSSASIISIFALVKLVLASKSFLGYFVDILATRIAKLKYSIYVSAAVR